MKKFPKVLYVARHSDNQEYFVCYESVGECMEEDGPTVVATYRLEQHGTFAKEVVEK